MNRNLENKTDGFFREIKGSEMKEWKPQRQGMAVRIIEDFLTSEIEMAEINLDALPQPESKGGSAKSTKQDSFASSFYAWKKKSSTKANLSKLGIDILLIRRSQQIALKKVTRKE